MDNYQAAIARLLVKRNGKNIIGTCFPVGPDLLLTCRHIVFGESCKEKQKELSFECEASWFRVDSNKEKKYKSSKVTSLALDLGEEYDLVLLRCSIPNKFQGVFNVASYHTRKEMRYSSSGYASIDNLKSNKARKQSGLDGVFCNPDARYSYRDIVYEGQAKDPSEWQGMSGAPVYRGRNVYGVVTGDHSNRASIIRVTSLPHCMNENVEFRSIVNPEEYLYNTDKLEEFISNNIALKQAIINKHDELVSGSDDTSGCFIEAITAINPADLLETLCGIVEEQGNGVHHTVKSFIALLLPLYVYKFVPRSDFDKVVQSVELPSNELIELPLFTIPWFESFMACLSNRPAVTHLVDGGKRLAAGQYCLPEPPECGINPVDFAVKNTSEEISKRLGGNSDFTEYLGHIHSKLPGTSLASTNENYHELVMTSVNVTLKRSYRKNNNKPAYYMVANSQQFKAWPVLRAAFPYLAILKPKRKLSNKDAQIEIDTIIQNIFSLEAG